MVAIFYDYAIFVVILPFVFWPDNRLYLRYTSRPFAFCPARILACIMTIVRAIVSKSVVLMFFERGKCCG